MKRNRTRIGIENRCRIKMAGLLIVINMISLGVQAASEQSRIIDGTEVVDDRYPWMVALERREISSVSPSLFCGGTLVARQWVLTTARCVVGRQPADILVAVGNVDLTSDQIDRIPLSKIVSHPGFSINGYRNIALLKLRRPVDASITPVRLAQPGTEIQRGTEIVAMGWGNIENFESTQRLREITVETGYPEICENMPFRFSRNLEICVVSRFRDQGSCYGDRGGPAILRDETTGEFVQVGINSWGNPGCDTHYGAVFERVSMHMPWINRQIRGQAAAAETGDVSLSTLHYCVGLECVFDVSWNRDLYAESGHLSGRFIWRTEDGGRKAGTDAAVFKHTFPASGTYNVQLSAILDDGRRETEKFTVDVEQNGLNKDRIRVKKTGNTGLLSANTIAAHYSNRGQGTWLYDGEARLTLRGLASLDMDLSLWKFNFATDNWDRVAQSRSLRSTERIRRRLQRGFYNVTVRFYGVEGSEEGTAELTTEFWRSKRDVCLLESYLLCRGRKP